MKEIRITDADAGQRLDKYLRKLLPLAGSGFLYKMLRKKNITLNGKKAEGKELLRQEDAICLFFAEETYAKLSGAASAQADGTQGAVRSSDTSRMQKAQEAYGKLRGITIVYEDEDLLFVNKPAGILSQGDAEGELSLNDWITGYCSRQASGRPLQPAVCNRLDRNTSGLVLCGKTYAGSRFLSDRIRKHELKKIYRALVEGHLSGGGILKGYWEKDSASNTVRITDQPRNAGAVPVETRYRSLAYDGHHTLVEVELVTGRSHQIRAHMASIGHPLAGDLKYGGHPLRGSRVQYLHAYEVRFFETEGKFAYLADQSFRCTVQWLEGV